MHVLANAAFGMVGPEFVGPRFLSLLVRKRHEDWLSDKKFAGEHPDLEKDPKYAYIRKMEDDHQWQSCGVMQLIDTRSGIATRLHYHGPSLEELGHIRLVARLAFKAFGRDVVAVVKEGPPIPMELEVYQLDPENQRIWLVNEDLSDAKLVWPEPGVDTFEQRSFTELTKSTDGSVKEG